jgi:succinate dehydrogenase/fumarate reductase flavoprotein subunit
VARRGFVANSPDVVEKTLRAFVRANDFVQDRNHQAAVVRSVQKWLRLGPNTNADALYERMRQLYDRRVAPTRDGLQNALRVLSKADPRYGKLKVDELIDDRLIRKIEAP